MLNQCESRLCLPYRKSEFAAIPLCFLLSTPLVAKQKKRNCYDSAMLVAVHVSGCLTTKHEIAAMPQCFLISTFLVAIQKNENCFDSAMLFAVSMNNGVVSKASKCLDASIFCARRSGLQTM
jgi:hypothetical protein